MSDTFYRDYAKNVYSQNGEDGIIEEVFKRLDINEGYLCEFGCLDGINLSNTYNLFKNNSNFKTILIEGNEQDYRKMADNFSDYLHVKTINNFVSSDPSSEFSLNNILTNIEDLTQENFKFLSIDVDGPDYEIWKNFTAFKPSVVLIEVNSAYPPEKEVYPCEPSGASAGIMVKLAKEKGYELICHTGNLLFVDQSLFSKMDIIDNSLEKLFSYSWVK